LTNILIVLGRMIIFAIVVALLAVIYHFLKRFSFFQFLKRLFQYTIIAIFNFAFIVTFSIGIGFVNNVLLYLLGYFKLTDIYALQEVGMTNITLIFILVFVALFLIGSFIFSRIPLTKRQFQVGVGSVLIIGTTIIFPVISTYEYPSVPISFLVALILSILSPSIFFIYLELAMKVEENKENNIRRNHSLSYREQRRAINRVRNRQEENSDRANKIRQAIMPWIYFRKQADD